jgi:hypothetical protein
MRPLPPMLLMRLLGCSGRLWQHVAEGGGETPSGTGIWLA